MKLCNGTNLKRLPVLAVALTGIAMTSSSFADQVLFDNKVAPAATGGFSTGPVAGNGTVAPAGAAWSELQHNTGNTTESNTTLGVSANLDLAGGTNPTNGIRVADDFVVPPGNTWNVSAVRVYAYQTGAPATPAPFDIVRLQIWNGVPGDPGSVVLFGDLATNRMVGAVDSLTFRTGDSVVPPPGTTPGTTRRVWQVNASTLAGVTTGAPLVLPAGTYWVEYQLSSLNNAAHFCPLVTNEGQRLVAGSNARQITGTAPGTWAALVDAGNPATAPDVAVDMPFQIVGSACNVPLPLCAADIAAPFGVVNIDDLLAVINSWGLDGNPTGPRPLGDVAPGANGNCIVNIDDLLAVINAWGSCPPLKGACCAPNGSCSQTTFAECTASSGSFHGIGKQCGSVTCPVFNNTNCTEATAVAVGGSATDTLETAALVTGNFVPCPATFGKGRWYTVVGNGKNLTVDTCGADQAIDFRLAVFCGNTCGNLACVDFSDDGKGCGLNPKLTWCSAVGQKYWILVDTLQAVGPGQGTYTLHVTDTGVACTPTGVCSAPINDECAGAIALACNVPATLTTSEYQFLTVNATDPSPYCRDGAALLDRSWWYKITTGPAQTVLNVSMCSSNSSLDTLLSLWSGSCGTFTIVACDDDLCTTPTAGPSKLCAAVTPNTTYFILVQHYNPSQPGDYIIEANCTTACGPLACDCTGTSEGFPCRVNGDDPALDPNGGCNSTPVAFGSTIALNEVKCGLSSSYTFGTGTFRDTDWYVFTVPATGSYRIKICPEHTQDCGFLGNGATGPWDITLCAPAAAFIAPGGFIVPPGIESILGPYTLTAGDKVALFVANGTGSVANPCGPASLGNKYKVQIVSP